MLAQYKGAQQRGRICAMQEKLDRLQTAMAAICTKGTQCPIEHSNALHDEVHQMRCAWLLALTSRERHPSIELPGLSVQQAWDAGSLANLVAHQNHKPPRPLGGQPVLQKACLASQAPREPVDLSGLYVVMSYEGALEHECAKMVLKPPACNII